MPYGDFDNAECEEMPDMMGDSPLDWMEEEEEERKDANSGMSGEEEDSSTDKSDSSSDDSSDNDSKSEETEENDSHITSGIEGGVSNDKDFSPLDPKAFTDEAWAASVKDLNEESDKIYEYVTVPKANLDEIMLPHKELYRLTREHYSSEKVTRNEDCQDSFEKAKSMVKEFKSKNSNTVDYLVKEFEMRKRADEYKRTSISKTGLLDMSSIHSYKYNDNLFKKVATIASGKNHGLVLFIDWSGSMHSNMAGTIDQLLNLVLFCKKVNIPFEVYAFTDRSISKTGTEVDNIYDQQKAEKVFFKKEGHICSSSKLTLMNLFSNTMSTSELNYAMQTMMMLKFKYDYNYVYNYRYQMTQIPRFFELGGTPLDATIIAALEVIPEFQKKNRVQIVNAVFLTDGDSHMNSNYWKSDTDGDLKTEYFSTSKTSTFYVDPITKKNYTNKGYSRGHSTSVLYNVLKDRLGVNILGFYLIGKRFNHLSRDISYGTKGAPDPHELMRMWRKEKSYVASNYLGYDKLYYIKDGQDLNVENEEFVVKEDASKSQLTKAFKNFNKRKLTNRIVLKSFAEMVA
jgi:hypothetical protein